MSGRRSKFEIYVDILTQIKNGVSKPTKIMYHSNLSWDRLGKILKSLIAQGFITERIVNERDKRTKRVYRITKKGDNVLRYSNNVKSLMELEVSTSLNE